jgi:hypothetical protein
MRCLFQLIYEIVSHGSLRLESEDNLYGFISKGIETNRKAFLLLESVRFEHYSTEVMTDFFVLILEHFDEINASV